VAISNQNVRAKNNTAWSVRSVWRW